MTQTIKTNYARSNAIESELRQLNFEYQISQNDRDFDRCQELDKKMLALRLEKQKLSQPYFIRDEDTLICNEDIIGYYAVTEPIKVSANDIDNIVCTAIEGGINYWAMIDRQKSECREKPKGMPLSSWVTKMLLDGKSVYFYDWEAESGDEAGNESERFELNLLRLINGIKLNCQHRPHDCDIETGDATTADCIFQYAMFNEIVYG